MALSHFLYEYEDYWHGLAVLALYVVYLDWSLHGFLLLVYAAVATDVAATRSGSLLALGAGVNSLFMVGVATAYAVVTRQRVVYNGRTVGFFCSSLRTQELQF